MLNLFELAGTLHNNFLLQNLFQDVQTYLNYLEKEEDFWQLEMASALACSGSSFTKGRISKAD